MNVARFDIPDAAVQAATKWRHDPDIALTEATPHILVAELERLAGLMSWDSDERVLRDRIAELRAVIEPTNDAATLDTAPPDAEL